MHSQSGFLPLFTAVAKASSRTARNGARGAAARSHGEQGGASGKQGGEVMRLSQAHTDATSKAHTEFAKATLRRPHAVKTQSRRDP